jgi:hypothetical protein
MWCYAGQPSEHVCYNFYSNGGSTFCEQFAALNQCNRADPAINVNESDHAPEWLPLVGAVGACVFLAFGIGLWATRAQLLAAVTAARAPNFAEPSDSQVHQDDAGPAEVNEVETGLAQPPSEGGDTPAREMCVVCLQRERTRMLYPCGHRVCCDECAQKLVRLQSVRCPVCRKPVRDTVHVYG